MLRFSTSAACCRVRPNRESVRQKVALVRRTPGITRQQPRVWRTDVFMHCIFELNLARKEDCSQPASRDSLSPSPLCDLLFTTPSSYGSPTTMADRSPTQSSTCSSASWSTLSAASHVSPMWRVADGLLHLENSRLSGHGPTRSPSMRLPQGSRLHASTGSFNGASANRRHFWSPSLPARPCSNEHPPLRAGVMPVLLRGTFRSGPMLHRSSDPAIRLTMKEPGFIVSNELFLRILHGDHP